MEFQEFTGKTVEEAVERGLKELGVEKDGAEIVVLEEGKKKLFGSVKARVQIAVKAEAASSDAMPVAEETETSSEEACEDTCVSATENADGKTDGERTVEFLEGLFKLLKITACTELVAEGEKVEINVTAANTTSIIGKRGVMLDAIQTLAGAVANTGREEYKRVVVDCENYRESREATLNKLADNLAQKAVRLGKKIKLEPMNPYERRIIHAALSDREGVTTQSEGKEPNRYIVVLPDNLEDPTAPAIMARNGQDRDHRNNNRGGRNGGYNKKPMNRDRRPSAGGNDTTGGTTMKANNDFFGIFLGNSGNDDKE